MQCIICGKEVDKSSYSHKIICSSEGRIVKSTNLWHNGTIPENFRDVLTDNAEFIIN